MEGTHIDFENFPYRFLLKDEGFRKHIYFRLGNKLYMKFIEEKKRKIMETRVKIFEIGGYRAKEKKRCTKVEPSHVIEAIEDIIGDGIELYEILQKMKKVSRYATGDEYLITSSYIDALLDEYFIFQIIYPEYIESLEHLLDSAYGREWWKRFPDGSIGFYENAYTPAYGGMFQFRIHKAFIPECLYRDVFEGSYSINRCTLYFLPWHTQKLYPELPLTFKEQFRRLYTIDVLHKVEGDEDYEISFRNIGPRKDIVGYIYRPLNFEYDREEMEEGEVRMSIIFANRPTKKAVQRLHDIVREWYEMVKDADEPYGKVMGMREVDFREEYEYRDIDFRKKCYGYRWELDLRGSNIETMAVLGAMLVRYSEEESRLGVVYFW